MADTTVFELNEGELKDKGYYLALVNRNMFRKERTMGGTGGGDAEYNIRQQTGMKFESIYSITEAEDPERMHTVTLNEREWAVTLTALAVYHDICFRMFQNEIEEDLKRLVTKLGEAQREGRL